MSNHNFTSDWSSTQRPMRVHMSDRRRIPSWITSQLLNYYRVHSQGISPRESRNRQNPAQNPMRRERKRARSNKRKQTRMRGAVKVLSRARCPGRRPSHANETTSYARARWIYVSEESREKPCACESPSGNLSDRENDFYFFTTARKDYRVNYYFVCCGDFWQLKCFMVIINEWLFRISCRTSCLTGLVGTLTKESCAASFSRSRVFSWER